MSSSKPRGILRNKQDEAHPNSNAEFLDRQEVIRNTKLNSKLASDSSQGDKIRAQIAEKKSKKGEDDKYPEHLHWDEVNLYKTEQEKSATMKIDEPKTPYEGGFNPEGEYYRDDDEEQIPEFELGQGEEDEDMTEDTPAQSTSRSLNGGEVVPSLELDEEQPSKPETAEERHKRFEEKRKAHYHMKAAPLKLNAANVDDDDEEEQK